MASSVSGSLQSRAAKKIGEFEDLESALKYLKDREASIDLCEEILNKIDNEISTILDEMQEEHAQAADDFDNYVEDLKTSKQIITQDQVDHLMMLADGKEAFYEKWNTFMEETGSDTMSFFCMYTDLWEAHINDLKMYIEESKEFNKRLHSTVSKVKLEMESCPAAPAEAKFK